MKHIILLDSLEKLTIKKDSTLLFAITLKKRGEDVLLVFEEDFFFSNLNQKMRAYDFEGELEDDQCYVKNFQTQKERELSLDEDLCFHMRLDPPFDSRYLRYLWMFQGLKEKYGVKVVNDPEGVLNFNEKILAYEHENSLETIVTTSKDKFLDFVSKIQADALILKPLDLYQGIGVSKIAKNDPDIEKHFLNKVNEYQGPVVAQVFDESVTEGEIRSIYFKGKEIGTIVKKPKEGEYLANIAQGASFKAVSLNETQKKLCDEMSAKLAEFGVPWIAFDILGNNLSEVNITCPGLLVEVSKAHEKNLAELIIDEGQGDLW